MEPLHETNPADLRARLGLLTLEREVAQRSSLSADNPYMTDLYDEIAAVERAYIGAAVTEIAMLRADLDGSLIG